MNPERPEVIDLLDRYLERLVVESGAQAAVIWSHIGDATTGSVVRAHPPDLLASTVAWPATHHPASGFIQRAPSAVAALVPTSVRLALPAPPVAALATELSDPDLELLLIWSEPPVGEDLPPELRLLIREEISYIARLLSQQSRCDREARRLYAVVDGLNHGVVSADHSVHTVTVNPAAAKLLRTASGEVEQSDFASAMTALEGRALNRGEIETMGRRLLADPEETIHCTWLFDQAPTHVRVSSYPVRQGAFSGRIWIFEDVSQAAEALDASRATEELLQANADSMLNPNVLFEAVRDGSGRVIDFRYRSANRATYSYLGVKEEDIIGSSALATLPNLEGSGLLSQYAHCVDTGEPVVLQNFSYFNEILDDGRRYDIQASRAGTDLISLTWSDVTDRFQAAERIRVSEERFRLLADNAGDAVTHVRNGRFVWVSPSLETLLGAPASYWVGRDVQEIIPPAGIPAMVERLSTLERGNTVRQRVQIVAADGVAHWVHLHAKPFYDVDGRKDGFTGAMRLVDNEVAAEKKLEAVRREKDRADELFRRSMDSAAVGMCITTPDGQLTDVNDALCRFFGYGAEILKQMSWQELTSPEYLEADLVNVEKMRSGLLDSYRVTKIFLHADGRPIWGDLSASCLRDSNGEILQFIGQIVDITVATEAAERFRMLAENAGDVVTHVRDGRFVWVSPSIEKVLGAPASYWVGRDTREIIPPEDADIHAARIKNLAEGGVIQGRARIMSVDGVRHWVHLRAGTFLDSDGRPDGVSSAFRVIDEEVAAEELVEQVRREQRKADLRYRRSMETSNIGMCLLAPDGTFVDVNPSLCEFLGYDADTLKRKTWQELTAPEYVNVGEEERTAVFEGRQDSYRIVKQYIHADGHRVWADVSVSCIRDENGKVEHLASQIADITEAVEAQKQLAIRDEQNRALAQRLQSEMRSAVKYVRSTLPGDLHGVVEMSSIYMPSEEIGGDGLNYRWLDDDHLKMYLIDVSGHGVRPALLSVTVHNLLRSGVLPMATLLDPDRLLGVLNTMFQMDDQDGAYFTIWYGIYENSTRMLRYASAGHPPALAFDRKESSVTVTPLGSSDKPIGMFADEQFTCQSYPVPEGAQLLVYSDGAFELPVDDGVFWSYDEFVALCARLAAKPGWSLDGLVNQLLGIATDGRFDDDCSLILATWT